MYYFECMACSVLHSFVMYLSDKRYLNTHKLFILAHQTNIQLSLQRSYFLELHKVMSRGIREGWLAPRIRSRRKT
jgi:hypothetical protein